MRRPARCGRSVFRQEISYFVWDCWDIPHGAGRFRAPDAEQAGGVKQEEEPMARPRTLTDARTARRAELVFIDAGVPQLEQLVAGLRDGVEAIVLHPGESAPAQMAAALAGRSELDAIHVIAHGRPGVLSFAAGALCAATLVDHAQDLGRLGLALAPAGRLALWSCEA